MITWLKLALGEVRLVPKWVWLLLAAALAYHFAIVWHHGQVRAHDQQLLTQRDAQWQGRLDQAHAQATDARDKFNAAAQRITQLQRNLTDEENRRIAADRDDLRLRGPGKAAAAPGCRPGDHPGLAGVASGPVAQPGTAANARTEVPAGDGQDSWAVVPWNWLVDVVSERDSFRIEALGWRSRDYMLGQEWERLRQQQLQAVKPLAKPPG